MAHKVSKKKPVVKDRLIKKAHRKDGLAFIKEVAKYFMDFLETDFHKRRNPKRSVQLRNSSDLLIGLNLNKYPSFNALAWKAIAHGFDNWHYLKTYITPDSNTYKWLKEDLNWVKIVDK